MASVSEHRDVALRGFRRQLAAVRLFLLVAESLRSIAAVRWCIRNLLQAKNALSASDWQALAGDSEAPAGDVKNEQRARGDAPAERQHKSLRSEANQFIKTTLLSSINPKVRRGYTPFLSPILEPNWAMVP